MRRDVLLCGAILPLLFGCGDDKNPETATTPAADAAPGAPAGHGSATELGTLTAGGKQFEVLLLGELVPGVEGAFEVHPQGMSPAEMAKLNVYLWVESHDGTQLSAASKGGLENNALHFHVTPRVGDKEPFRVVLRLREEGLDERASLPLDGHGHEHLDGPHDGMLAGFAGGPLTGRLELKLHDDKGDLELWLAMDDAITQPFDLPLEASVEVEFVDVGGRKVTLHPRNQESNEDEAGTANIRNGRTNYFIFPSKDGEDASWLQGAEFQSIVIVRFSRGGEPFVSEEFVLKPHTH